MQLIRAPTTVYYLYALPHSFILPAWPLQASEFAALTLGTTKTLSTAIFTFIILIQSMPLFSKGLKFHKDRDCVYLIYHRPITLPGT
jgi:hypothetical protein